MSPSKYKSKYDDLNSAFEDNFSFQTKLLKAAANANNDIKKYFFGTTNQSEIDSKLSSSESDKEKASIKRQMEDIENNYMEFDANNSTEAQLLIDEGIRVYPEYVTLANKFAKLNNYDNYLNYAYKDVYMRDYTPEQGLEFAKNFKSAFANQGFLGKEISLVDDGSADYINAQKINRTVFNQVGNPAAKLLDSYSKFLGGKFNKTYNNLWKNGYFELFI